MQHLFPKPFKITLNGLVLTLLAFSAILIAPSAAAKDSCPAKKDKTFQYPSSNNIEPKLPCPKPTLRSSATDPGIQNDCKPTPIVFAASRC